MICAALALGVVLAIAVNRVAEIAAHLFVCGAATDCWEIDK